MSDAFDLSERMEGVTYEQRLAVTQWVMRKIVEHARDGGSYRYLIYDMDAYAPLCGDGLTISNEFDLNVMDELREIVKSEGIESDRLKRALGFCDEPGCRGRGTVGQPTDAGYRWTCWEHRVNK